jgi:oligosaccharyltransferase complex subunit epsilon
MAPNPSSKDQQVSVFNVVGKLYDDYLVSTPKKIKLIDAYMFCIMLTGIIQFVYCLLVGTFPFNAFLSGFISTVASFVLAGKTSSIKLF